MWPYWLLFLLPALFALNENSRLATNDKSLRVFSGIPFGWWLLFIFISLMIGWRHQVGGDWEQYLYLFDLAKYESHDSEWWLDDPGYRFIEWFCQYLGWSHYAVNLIAASFFSFGLIVFCRNLPRPWLGIAVSVPYLVIILGMGYTRQGVALGFIMIALAALEKGFVKQFVIWAILGAMFHKSGVLVLPLAAMSATKNRVVVVFWLLIVGFFSYVFLLQDSLENLQKNYLEAEYQSEGAMIRLSMNLVPATLILWKRKAFMSLLPDSTLWIWFAIISFILMGLYFVSPSSTAIDRVGLYLLPLQVMAFAYAPMLLGGRSQQSAIVILVLVYYAAVEFVWLNYAATAFAWLPYRFYPLESVF